MKAWQVNDQYDEYSTVVFAETRNQAKLKAMHTDCCEDMEYIYIRPIRFEAADAMYRGQEEMDWNDPDDRRFLAEHGWACVEPDRDECQDCPAAGVCIKHEEDEE